MFFPYVHLFCISLFFSFLRIFKSIGLRVKCCLSILVVILEISCTLNLSKSRIYQYLYLCLEKIRIWENWKSIYSTSNLYTIVVYLFSLKTLRQIIILFKLAHIFTTFFILLFCNSELQSETTLILLKRYALEFLLMKVSSRFMFVFKY